MVATTSQPPLVAEDRRQDSPLGAGPGGGLGADEVVLLDERRRPVGTAPRLAVHDTDTPLHLAFSCYVRDEAGRVLLTRRALGKRTWPGVWTNSCCGHPRPGEPISDAVRRRLRDELGLEVGALTEVLPDFAYRATDASGVVENEFCPVFVAAPTQAHPVPTVHANGAEVMEWRWVGWSSLVAAVDATPFAFSPWAAQQVPLLQAARAWV